MKTTISTRRIEFEGCVNFRDLGGYVVAAVILSLSGVREGDIVADYALTEEYLGIARVASSHADSGPASKQRQVPPALLTASPDTRGAS